MRLSLASFSQNGARLMEQLSRELEQSGHLLLSAMTFGAGAAHGQKLGDWTRNAFSGDGIIFIGACGIAVRTIAPYIKDKFSDPAVVVVDEKGRFCISLLSGHVGGANSLAIDAAKLIGAVPVVTTATDVNGKFAVDVWAHSNGLHICERSLAKEVSAALLRGESVGFASPFQVDGELAAGLTYENAPLGIYVGIDEWARPFEKTLHLIPKIVTLGSGCRRGVPSQVYETAVSQLLREGGISLYAIYQVATIDIKRDEECLRFFCLSRDLPLKTFSADELMQAQGSFSQSEFVRGVTGVDNVCERAAVLAGAGELVLRKHSKNAVTVAAVADSWRVCFECPNDGNRLSESAD